ncbi:hypothetical protein CBL_07244 [Carabus blaptoides fortunei]
MLIRLLAHAREWLSCPREIRGGRDRGNSGSSNSMEVKARRSGCSNSSMSWPLSSIFLSLTNALKLCYEQAKLQPTGTLASVKNVEANKEGSDGDMPSDSDARPWYSKLTGRACLYWSPSGVRQSRRERRQW